MTSRAFYDIETDGLLDELTEILLLVVKPEGVDEYKVFHKSPSYGADGDIEDGLNYLDEFEIISGHNVLGFDNVALDRVYGWTPLAYVLDTAVLARLIYPDVASYDYKEMGRSDDYPRDIAGKHSLDAWGKRIGGQLKGEYSGEFAKLDQALIDYCIQDVAVTEELYQFLKKDMPPQSVVDLEHEFAQATNRIERTGFHFNIGAATQLYATLSARREELTQQVANAFPPKQIQLKTKVKEVPFNPNSRDQIAYNLEKKYGWKPTQFTPSGKPQIDEKVLRSLDYPEAKLLGERLGLQKHIGLLAEGDQSWLKLVTPQGRLHGRIIHNSTRTHRCAHARPNLGQVPSAPEFRSLFGAKQGRVLVGCDLSGLELRMLCHYMRDDDYTETLLNGDIHTRNMEAWEINDRSLSKKLTYATLYGGGNALLGEILGGGLTEGRKARKRFMNNLPALKRLLKDLDRIYKERGYLKSLDGRKVEVPSKHVLLNTLLQSSGAIVAKQWVALCEQTLRHLAEECAPVAMVHDEVQYECSAGIASKVGDLLKRCASEAGYRLEVRLPIDAEYSVGDSWAETH